ncbi:MAG: hypothetical protein I8H87_10360 [Comamonadaceae bacterium]|nr:hypothetical protein [Comamonadaceae bacterium]
MRAAAGAGGSWWSLGGPGAVMPVERVRGTILGAALGIVFVVIFSSMDDRVYLHEHRSKDAAGR